MKTWAGSGPPAAASVRAGRPAARPARPRPPIAGREARRFVIALGLATALPWIVLPLFGSSGAGLGAHTLRRLAYISGPPHVVSTFALYFDPAIRPFFARRRTRFVYAPIAILVVTPAVFWLLPGQAVALGLALAGGWTIFHFSRQNIGVLSFVFAARDRSAPTALDRTVLTVVGCAGILGVLSYSDVLTPSGLGSLRPTFQLLAGGWMAVAAAFTLPRLWQLRHDLICCLFYVESVAFFAPIFFLSDRAAIPYAVAHGYQYLVFMAFLVKHRPGGALPVRALVVAALLITVVGGAGVLLLTRSDNAVLVGLVVAVSAVHFSMDASIWRLREPFQRGYVRERFAFLAR